MNPLPYAALLLALALPASPASADQRSGPLDCFVEGVALIQGESGQPDTYSALLVVEGVVTAYAEPVSADVTCSIWVDGALQGSVTVSGTTVVAGAGPTEFTSEPIGDVDVCMTVDFTSDDAATEDWCFAETSIEFPSRAYWDAAYGAASSVPGGADAVCAAALAAEPLVPDVWGRFGIGSDGTIAVGSQTSGWAACPEGT